MCPHGSSLIMNDVCFISTTAQGTFTEQYTRHSILSYLILFSWTWVPSKSVCWCWQKGAWTHMVNIYGFIVSTMAANSTLWPKASICFPPAHYCVCILAIGECVQSHTAFLIKTSVFIKTSWEGGILTNACKRPVPRSHWNQYTVNTHINHSFSQSMIKVTLDSNGWVCGL